MNMSRWFRRLGTALYLLAVWPALLLAQAPASSTSSSGDGGKDYVLAWFLTVLMIVFGFVFVVKASRRQDEIKRPLED